MDNSLVYSQALVEQLKQAGDILFGRGKERIAEGSTPGAGVLGCLSDAKQVSTLYEAQLLRADSYYWSPPLCQFLEDTARDIPDWTLCLSDLPTERGFIWFAEPLKMPNYDADNKYPLAALSWSEIYLTIDPNVGPGKFVDHLPGEPDQKWLALAIYFKVGDKIKTGGMTSWMDGEHLSSLLEDEQRSPQYLVALGNATARYFAASMSFLEQQILVAPRQEPNRGVRRHLPPFAHSDSMIRVVHLRRSQKRAKVADGTSEVNWQCQWIVRGHWRDQWYMKSRMHKPRWIAPYVKGPDGKFLKRPSHTIFAVVR